MWKAIPRTQGADLNFIQSLFELFPATVIGLGYIENDNFALGFPLGTGCYVRSGRLWFSRVNKKVGG